MLPRRGQPVMKPIEIFREQSREFAERLKAELRTVTGGDLRFSLIVWEPVKTGEHYGTAYISNCERAGAIEVLKDATESLEAAGVEAPKSKH